MIADALKHLIFDQRRAALNAEREHRELAALIDNADAALLADDERHTAATERDVVRAIAALSKRVATTCRDRKAACNGCPYLEDGKYHLVDGRTLCEAASAITDKTKLVRDSRAWVDACQRETNTAREVLNETVRVSVADLRAQVDRGEAALKAAKDDCAAAERDLADAMRALGVK